MLFRFLVPRPHSSRAADIDAHPLHWFAKISSSRKYSQVHVVSRLNACQQQKYPWVENNFTTSYSTLTKESPTRTQASRSNNGIRWHAWVVMTRMAFGQIVGVVITWRQVIGMIWWEPRPDDVGKRWRRFDNHRFIRWRRPRPILGPPWWTWARVFA